MPHYDPQKHHRRSIRLKGWDYSNPGHYFVTIDLKNRKCLFGKVRDNKMILNEFGKICNECWLAIPDHFDNVKLDTYQIMPNHLHGIIVITKRMDDDGTNGNAVGATHASPLQNDSSPLQKNNDQHPPCGPKPGSLGAIIGSFRSAVSNRINKLRQTPGAKLWQRDYWEHIIRNETELHRIRRYIINNPLNWTDDDCYETE